MIIPDPFQLFIQSNQPFSHLSDNALQPMQFKQHCCRPIISIKTCEHIKGFPDAL
jgi:hypothetical protein